MDQFSMQLIRRKLNHVNKKIQNDGGKEEINVFSNIHKHIQLVVV